MITFHITNGIVVVFVAISDLLVHMGNNPYLTAPQSTQTRPTIYHTNNNLAAIASFIRL